MPELEKMERRQKNILICKSISPTYLRDHPLPDYFTCLNACAIMRSSIKSDRQRDFVDCLSRIVGIKAGWPKYADAAFELVDACSEEQAEAYGQAFKLWKSGQ